MDENPFSTMLPSHQVFDMVQKVRVTQATKTSSILLQQISLLGLKG